MSRIIEFKRQGIRFLEKELTLGDDLIVGKYQNCRLIKVTRKGFNILNLDTNKTLFSKAVYMRGMGNKEFPRTGVIKGVFRFPMGHYHYDIIKKETKNQAAS